MNTWLLLLLNLALGFYNVGTIWAHEVDIFRTWRLVGPEAFHRIQEVHWRELPYWVFGPVGLAFIGALLLVWNRPPGSPAWFPWAVLGTQLASHVLTAGMWGPWQAKLSRDPRGSASPYLSRILATHWIRTLLITASALLLLAWTATLPGLR